MASVTTHSDIVFFKADNTNNPHALTIAATDYHEYTNSTISDSTWAYTDNTASIPNSHYAEYLVNSFSGGGGGAGTGTNGGALPVELLSFAAEQQKDQVILEWKTAMEKKNKGFEIQRSEDGKNWRNIAFVPGKGTTSLLTEYRYVDLQPHPINYYRLKQIDLDGKFIFSKIIPIDFKVQQEVKVYPNPNYGHLNIEILTPLKNESLQISIVNPIGQIQIQKTIANNSSIINFETPDLEGLYYLVIRDDADHILWHKKVLFIR